MSKGFAAVALGLLHVPYFYVVALIAVIRRILVITAGHAGAGEGPSR